MNVRLRRGGLLARSALFAGIGVLVGAGVLVWARTEITRQRYNLMQLHQTETRLRDGVEKLRIEAAALAAPDRIEREARRMGLRYPHPGEVIAIEGMAELADPRDAPSAPGDRP